MKKERNWSRKDIEELNNWVNDDNASSVGAVLLRLQDTISFIEQGGKLIVMIDDNELLINSKQSFFNFITCRLANGEYFVKRLSDKLSN